jgi:hypothetical protein
MHRAGAGEEMRRESFQDRDVAIREGFEILIAAVA